MTRVAVCLPTYNEAENVGLMLDAVLGVGSGFLSSRIGESLIFDLRTQVFAHVQRMSLAFFTRTQTGALVSRLNNDVIGAQRAFTSTLSSTVSNSISVVVVGIAMLALSWQVTLLCLLLFPVLLATSRWVGNRLAGLTREQMNGNAALATAMTERFSVGGALLTPGSLALMQASFRPGDRARAIGAWSGLGGVAGALGPLVGGVLLEVSWRLVFLINLPLAALVVVVALRHVPESRDLAEHGTARKVRMAA